jgi:thiol peroxidase
VVSASEYKDDNFSKAYGVLMTDGPLKGLLSRAVVVVDADGTVKYTEQVADIVQEPNYDAALNALK